MYYVVWRDSLAIKFDRVEITRGNVMDKEGKKQRQLTLNSLVSVVNISNSEIPSCKDWAENG